MSCLNQLALWRRACLNQLNSWWRQILSEPINFMVQAVPAQQAHNYLAVYKISLLYGNRMFEVVVTRCSSDDPASLQR
jgi:hypothetical protein